MTNGNTTDPDDLLDLALQHHEAGRLAAAEALYAEILQIDATHPGALFYLGGIAYADGRHAFAAELIGRALADQPDDGEAMYLMALIEQALGRTSDAIRRLQQLLALHPNATAHNRAGELLCTQERIDEAIAHFQAAIALDPDNVEALCGLGMAFKIQYRLDEAAQTYRRALALAPDQPVALTNLGQILQVQGNLDEAIAIYRRELALRPGAATYSNLGSVLYAQDRIDDAIECYRKALLLDPAAAMAHNNLGVALCALGRLDDAVASYRSAIAARFEYPEAHRNLGVALKDRGELEAAVISLRQALDLKPDYLEAYSDYLMTLPYLPDISRERLFEEHVQFGERLETPLRASWPRHDRSRAQAGRRLRIGFVSSDLYMHPVGFFLENALRHIDRTQLDIVLYSNNGKTDALTARLRAMDCEWVSLVGIGDDEAAHRIQADAIDILVDLSGHTGDNRLRIFARKPAPVQVTWLGYWATTGLRAIDYILCDAHGLPADESRFFVEKPWYLPDTRLCFTPPADAVPVHPLPALERGLFTFGCFNNLSKMTDRVVAVWSHILRDAAGSRLFLKSAALAGDAVQRTVLARFAAHGIGAERLLFEGSSTRAQYLAAYQRVDLALDPFPFTGGTTSIEGLWMGVPVLTLRGDRMIGHQGEAILNNLGLSDWIAADTEDYVRQAVARAADTQSLARLRGELRTRLMASPLCDGPEFARNLERAFRGMWDAYCTA